MLKRLFVLIGQMEEKEQKNLLNDVVELCEERSKVNLNFYMKILYHSLKKLRQLLKKFIMLVKLWQIQK